MVSVITLMVSPDHLSGPVGAATSPLLVWQVIAAALLVSAPLDDLSAVHEATALGETHLHLVIFSLGGL